MRPTVQPTVLKNWVIYEKSFQRSISYLQTLYLHKIQLFFINHPVSGVNYHCNRTSKFWHPHWKVCIFLLQIKLSSKKTFLFCTYNTCIALGIFANYDFILCKAIDIILWIVCHAAIVNGYFVLYQRPIPGVALVNFSTGQIFMGKGNTLNYIPILKQLFKKLIHLCQKPSNGTEFQIVLSSCVLRGP